MKKKRNMETFNLSFLDVVCCGFGSVILLLVLTKIYEPVTIDNAQVDLKELVVSLEKELNLITGESTVLNQTLTEVREQLSEHDEQKNRLTGDLSKIEGEFAASKALAEEKTGEMNALLSARQSMTQIMKRLLEDYNPKDETTVGGIPVDSEYIIFVIDTSGSMYQGPWNLVIQKITETLAVYPRVKGIQVLNDEGEYMFSSYSGQWIPDSPAIRKNITSRLRYWNPYSDSSPVEGITEAINTFYDRDKKISIYVFGDDFSRGSVEAVCRYVARINKADRFGNRLVRIHGIGFPTQIGTANGANFAHLMRKLAEQNGGTFVGLPHL
jgi:hypothetical protein